MLDLNSLVKKDPPKISIALTIETQDYRILGRFEIINPMGVIYLVGCS